MTSALISSLLSNGALLGGLAGAAAKSNDNDIKDEGLKLHDSGVLGDGEEQSKEDKADKEEKAEKIEDVSIKNLSKDDKNELLLELAENGVGSKALNEISKSLTIPGYLLKKYIDSFSSLGDSIASKLLEKGRTVIPHDKKDKKKIDPFPLEPKEGLGTVIDSDGLDDKVGKRTIVDSDGLGDKVGKGTVMEIPEKDLSRLIEMVGSEPDWKSPVLGDFAKEKGIPLSSVVSQLKAYLKQRQLESDALKQYGPVRKYEDKINDPAYKKEHEEAAKKYSEEHPSKKWDDIKKKNEAQGKKYTGVKHSNEGYSAVQRAEDFAQATGSPEWVKGFKRTTAPGKLPKVD